MYAILLYLYTTLNKAFLNLIEYFSALGVGVLRASVTVPPTFEGYGAIWQIFVFGWYKMVKEKLFLANLLMQEQLQPV